MNDSPQPNSDGPSTKKVLLTVLIVLVVVPIIGALVLYPAVRAAREAARRAACISGFKMEGMAIHNYHDMHKAFPPAYLADEHGKPMHSWRVLLMPYLESRNFYERYRFDEPWDSPHNSTLAERPDLGFCSQQYLCPSDPRRKTHDTSSVMPVGPGAISDGPNSTSFGGIPDGSSNTIVRGEMCPSGIHWMEPRDLDVRTMSYKINDPNGTGFRSYHPGIVNVLFGDGSVTSVSEDIDPDLLKALITIDGGEPVNEFHNR
jgi:prepilin-type processing-associated H-X9-DG protein